MAYSSFYALDNQRPEHLKLQQLKTQIVIAGAGPVGGVAAFYLASAGIDVILLESGSDCALDLRASTFHPPTLEILDQFGITKKLIEKGLKAPVYQFRERESGEAIEFDLSEISDVTRFPFRIQCEQYHLSRMLSDGVRNLPGADVRFATYPEKFLCFTTNEPLEKKLSNLCYVNYVSDPKEWMVLLKVPSLWRVLVPAKDDQSDAELLGDEKKNDVFGRLIGGGEKVQTAHRTIYRVHQRVAKRFLHDRVAIIGDAAHLNNPIGGFGMNSGIHDAYNLCDKFVRIYNQAADADQVLGVFERQRRKTTHDFIQAQTIRNMEYLSEGAGEQHRKRKTEMERLHSNADQRREFLLRQSMIQCLEQERELA